MNIARVEVAARGGSGFQPSFRVCGLPWGSAPGWDKAGRWPFREVDEERLTKRGVPLNKAGLWQLTAKRRSFDCAIAEGAIASLRMTIFRW